MEKGNEANRHSDYNRVMKQWNASDYDQHYSYVSTAASSLIDLLGPQPGERILDLGCGTGLLTKAIADRGAQVLGLDASSSMIEAAKSQFPSLTFERADACTYQTEQRFDAVFSNAVLHWIRTPEAAAKTVFHVLNSGGRFVAELGGHGNVAHIEQAIKDESHSLEINLPNPWYFPTVGEYSTVLEKQGFEVSFAVLFDRPTPLQKGVRGWVDMFGTPFLESVPDALKEKFLKGVEDRTRATLFKDGQWTADHRRLRIVALKI